MTDRTIRQRRLGFNPTKRNLEGLWMWEGIVIPCFVDGRIWNLKVRRSPPGPKYKQVKGSGQFALYGLEQVRGSSAVVICESEFDAMLLHQEAGELIDVVATGGAGHRPCGSSIAELLGATHWVVALDRDRAGDKGYSWWMDFSARVHRARPLQGKDITDFYLEGGDLRAWVLYHLDKIGAESSFKPVESRCRSRSAPKPRSTEMEHHAEELLARCDGSLNWAREWAQVAREAGWPCFGTRWEQWVSDVAGSRDLAFELSRPTKPCTPFWISEHRRFWKGPGGWICATCHPPPKSDVEIWDLPSDEP